MGVINAENNLKFRSTSELFARINKRLSSFSSQSMIDVDDFYQYIVEVIELLGVGVYKECEWVGCVENHKVKLPCNYKFWYAGYKVHPEVGFVPSINEQKPWIWYQDNEISQVCPPGVRQCNVDCHQEDLGRTKIVVRTYVNGDSFEERYHNPLPLVLSPNVKFPCAPHAERMIRTAWNEVTIDDEGWLHTKFEHDSIYLQYYGLPFDENLLPMIPDQTSIEKAIEYHIYCMLFEEWYFNKTVPDIVQTLGYVKQEYKQHMDQALYYVKLPSFQRCLQSVKIMRSKNKFYQFNFDRTDVANHRGIRAYTGYPIV